MGHRCWLAPSPQEFHQSDADGDDSNHGGENDAERQAEIVRVAGVVVMVFLAHVVTPYSRGQFRTAMGIVSSFVSGLG